MVYRGEICVDGGIRFYREALAERQTNIDSLVHWFARSGHTLVDPMP